MNHSYQTQARTNAVNKSWADWEKPIGNVCAESEKRLLQCAAPCRDTFVDIPTCHTLSCRDVNNKASCMKSCTFMESIYAFKSGICPRVSLGESALAEVKNCCYNTMQRHRRRSAYNHVHAMPIVLQRQNAVRMAAAAVVRSQSPTNTHCLVCRVILRLVFCSINEIKLCTDAGERAQARPFRYCQVGAR